jgi:deoxyribodipyrimidine photo-lyase
MALMTVQASLADARDAFLEQLVIRRELAVNFVHYTPNYDSFDVIPGWANNTLADHEPDPRQYIYSEKQLADAATHDPYWNAAMMEMTCTGFMHNYMRMYWGKKILEWSPSPKQAYETTLALNNRYFLDGRDPNSYTGVAWLFGIHDRAWAERAIFGKVRYMAASGLERKCDIATYVDKINQRCASL